MLVKWAAQQVDMMHIIYDFTAKATLCYYYFRQEHKQISPADCI